MFSFLPPTLNGHSLSLIVKNTTFKYSVQMVYVKNSNAGKDIIISKSGADREVEKHASRLNLNFYVFF